MDIAHSERCKKVILSQLSMKAACRSHLHYECCKELGFELEPKFNKKGQRIRMCKSMPDSWFDRPLADLLRTKLVKKVKEGKRIENFVFYKITEKGRKEAKRLSKETSMTLSHQP